MGDIDQAGIIYFARVYSWHEALFTSWMADIGAPLSRLLARGLATATVASSADYIRPLRLDDRVCLELRASHVGRASFRYRTVCTKLDDPEPCVIVESTHVWTVMTAGTSGEAATIGSAELPSWFRKALNGEVTRVEPF